MSGSNWRSYSVPQESQVTVTCTTTLTARTTCSGDRTARRRAGRGPAAHTGPAGTPATPARPRHPTSARADPADAAARGRSRARPLRLRVLQQTGGLRVLPLVAGDSAVDRVEALLLLVL